MRGPSRSRWIRITQITAALIAVAVLAAVGAPRLRDALAEARYQRTVAGGLPDTRLVAAHTRFGFDLFRRLAPEGTRENVFFSPCSAAMALAMAYNGASGGTQAAMAKALRLDGLSLADTDHGSARLLALLNAPGPRVRIAVANSLWMQEGVPVERDFIRRNREAYDAEVDELDFRGDPSGAAQAINAWASDHTSGKIDHLLDTTSPETRLVLASAVYFHGAWREAFHAEDTRNAPFTLLSGRQVSVPMMGRTGDFRSFQGNGFVGIALPYANGHTSMYIFLPDKKDGLPAILRTLDADRWAEWLRGFDDSTITLRMPRFRITWGGSLKRPLTRLGMGVAFTEQADFRAMTPARVSIEDVVQSAYVDVNEEGTEAAAATEANVTAAVVAGSEVVVDHPFLCAIRDDETGEILFLGAVYDPTAG